MATYGQILSTDSTHLFQALGGLGYWGYSDCIDTSHLSSFSGYITSQSIKYPGDSTFYQGSEISWDNGLTLTLTLMDRTYIGGHWDGTTYIDSTLWRRDQYYDPIWIYYGIYYLQPPDRSDSTLIGYRYRDPIEQSVGQYYAPMIIPNIPGQYEVRWVYQKDNSSYATEVVKGFVSKSYGVDNTKDYS